MRKVVTVALTLVMAMITLSIFAQAPQTGIYRIQNVGSSKYIKVNGKYDATPNVTSQSEASYITVGIEKKLDDGSYKVNSLYSTYDGGSVEVYSFIDKALMLGETELRRELEGSSREHILQAISRMKELVNENAFIRIKAVDNMADTYQAIAKMPVIPADVVAVWHDKKNSNDEYVSQITGGNTMWDWCIDLVYSYLGTHGTDAGLKAKIINNLKNIKEGHTYMLKDDNDGSFGYIDIAEGPINTFTYWKLTPKVNNENVKDGTYKIRNIGKGDNGYVQITGKYHAKPNADEANASDIRITFGGTNKTGDQKIINLGGTYNGTDIEIYDYIEKAIFIGKTAIYNVLKPGNDEGVNPASPANIEKAQQTMEEFIKDNAFMSIKPVSSKDDAVYAYVYIPEVPFNVAEAMYDHGAFNGEGFNLPQEPTLADLQAAAWAYGVKKVKEYLGAPSGQGGTDNTLRTYVLANIDNIKPNTTYYLGAHVSDGTFDYYPKGEGNGYDNDFNTIKDNLYYQWGFDVEEVEEDNLTSGTYKVRNVKTGDYVQVKSRYYAKPDVDEKNASEIHITYAGKLDDGSYKVTNLSSTFKDGDKDVIVDIASYIQKAIRLGKTAIANVLEGKSSEENIEYAKQYLEDFVNENAYMRVKPVAGTNYVYAIATIPEIPDTVAQEMYNHGVLNGITDSEGNVMPLANLNDWKAAAWQYGINYVMGYLDGHPNSSLVALVTNNIKKIYPGHTYYLSEDEADQTFGYKDYDNNEVDLNNPLLQWGIDLEEEDQPVESDFYKIHNVGNDKYVKVEGRYYARPAYTEEEATPIAVTIAEGQLEDGSFKVTNLVGDGHDIQKYIDHAIELGNALIDQLIGPDTEHPSSDENIERAKNAMEQFVRENAYMRVKPVPGETEAYYAYVVLPTVPDSIVAEWEKKYPNYNGTMRDWAVEKVIEYLDNHPQVDGKLALMVRNNIEKLYEGHTYYLRADGDNTFGIGDFNEGEVDLTNRYYWWGFADAKPDNGETGFFRIRNAEGVNGKSYVNVVGPFKAIPNLTADEALKAPGSVIYVEMGDSFDKSFPITNMRSQGVALATYIEVLNSVLDVIPEVASKMADQFLAESSRLRPLVKPAVETLIESVDKNFYAEPTFTKNNEPAYFIKASIPDLNEYSSLATEALSFIGKTPADLVEKIDGMMEGQDGIMLKLLEAAKEMAEQLGQPNAGDEIWRILKRKANTVLNNEQYYSMLTQIIPEDALTLLKNNLDKLNHGTTYCLSEDSYATLDFMSREDANENDLAKWIFVPFENVDTCFSAQNFDESLAKLVVVADANHTQNTVDPDDTNPADGSYVNIGNEAQFATTYLDFEAKILNQGDTAYKVTATRKYVIEKNENISSSTRRVYYLATLTPVELTDGCIEIQTPVVLKSENSEIELFPTGTPNKDAVESIDVIGDLQTKLDEIIGSLTDGGSAQPAPRLRNVISDKSDDNMLYASLLGAEPGTHEEGTDEWGDPIVKTDSYLPIKDTENKDGDLYMEGLGFWNDPVTKLEPNTAYLKADGATDYNGVQDTYGEGNAPGYIFEILDEEGNSTFTKIEAIAANKEIKLVRYYNIAGIESNKPFDGINVVVTTYSDGSKSVAKILRK